MQKSRRIKNKVVIFFKKCISKIWHFFLIWHFKTYSINFYMGHINVITHHLHFLPLYKHWISQNVYTCKMWWTKYIQLYFLFYSIYFNNKSESLPPNWFSNPLMDPDPQMKILVSKTHTLWTYILQTSFNNFDD